ncbi:UDP-N-acetylmuramoyl-tripeptide--D-alanyl-D-alanine ligase [Candidatus Microgenomates bacterium]|nr:UDP-N-acetylmuramoyl-tripeptide--D-alanyl-D-alanine ligase [Candidatus Microgenomates bacterium]
MKRLLKKLAQFVLRALSARVLLRFHPDIIGITGSVGKTSTKEAIFAVLSPYFFVGKNIGSYNTEIGLPLTILGASSSKNIFLWPFILIKVFYHSIFIQQYFDKLILEMGADHFGDIKKLTDLARPRVGVITRIAPAHLEFFGNIDNVAKEKSNLIKVLPSYGWAILNYDDPKIRAMASKTKARVLFFGLDKKATIWADKIESNLEGVSFALHYFNQSAKIKIPKVYGRHQIYSALAAFGVGIACDLDFSGIVKFLPKFQLPYGRVNLVRGQNNTIIIDDSYNANPESTMTALDTLGDLALSAKAKRKIIFFGDMLELGKDTLKMHRDLAPIFDKHADIIVTIGPLAKNIHRKIKGSYHFADSTLAANFASGLIEKKDIILIKGSRGMEMEKIVEKIKLRK